MTNSENEKDGLDMLIRQAIKEVIQEKIKQGMIDIQFLKDKSLMDEIKKKLPDLSEES